MPHLDTERCHSVLQSLLVYMFTLGRQRWSLRSSRLSVEDEPLQAAGRGQLGDGLRHGKETRRLHPSVPLPALDIQCHEGERNI